MATNAKISSALRGNKNAVGAHRKSGGAVSAQSRNKTFTGSKGKASVGGAIAGLVGAGIGGAAGAYAFVEYSPYRLYWPW